MTVSKYFLGMSPNDMAEVGIVGSMTLEHRRIRYMHEALEALIAKLKAGNAAELVKQLRINILLTGETGTGKELVAKALWLRLSKEGLLPADKRKDDYFGSLNCACLSEEIFEQELFGTAEGAYSDARDRLGLVPRLSGFTKIDAEKKDSKRKILHGSPRPEPALLFLDEIGAADKPVQAKLLRLLENREFVPLGLEARRYEAPYLIILSATNELSPSQSPQSLRDPSDPADSGVKNASVASDSAPASSSPAVPDAGPKLARDEFRQDLFYRLGDTFHFHLPPLCDRPDEIPLIAEQFYQRYYRLFFDQQANPSLPSELGDLLISANWPGNGRQLHQVIRRAMILWEDAKGVRTLVDLMRKDLDRA
jgi:transcriptional regulator with PAS, ATPase and Fis domain